MTATSVLFSRLPDLHVRKPPKLVHEFDFDNPPTHISKDSMPLLSLAKFGDKPTPDKGCYRNDENVVALLGVVGDYDGSTPPISIAEAERRLTAAGIAATLYTTPSWTEENPRWRVLAWFSREMSGTPEELAAIYEEHLSRVQGALGADCPLKSESWAMSQSFYFGRVKGVPYKCLRSVGAPVDSVTWGPRIGNISPGHAGGDGRPVMPIEKAIEILRSGEDVHGGAKDLAWHRVLSGRTDDEIREEIISLAEESPRGAARLKALEAGELDRLIEGARKKTGAVPPEEEFEREDDTGWEPPGRPEPAEVLSRPVEAPGDEFWNCADVISQPPPVWLVRDVIHRKGLCVIYGEPGSGKSALAFAVTMALGGGAESVLGDLKVSTRGGVLYFAMEGNLRTRTQPYFTTGKVQGRPHVRFEQSLRLGLEPKYDENWIELHEKVALAKAADPDLALLVIDTLARVAEVDENSADLGQVAERLNRLSREADIAVVLVHHSGKDATKGARGHSSLKGAVDTEIEVLNERGQDGRPLRRTFRVSKQREGEEGLAREFTLEVVELGVDPQDPLETVRGILCQVEAGHATPGKVGKVKATGPTKAIQKKVFSSLVGLLAGPSPHPDAAMTSFGLGVPVDVLLEDAKTKLPVEEGAPRDRRKETARKSLQTIGTEFIRLVEEGGVQYAVLTQPAGGRA